MIALALAALLVPVSPASVDLIVRYEVGSRARYEARYQRPIWPGLHSGPTIGIGSDLGMQSVGVIRQIWAAHPQLERDRKSTSLNYSHYCASRMPSSA